MKFIKWLSVLCLSVSLVACQTVDTSALPIEFGPYTVDEYDGWHTYAVLNGNVPEFDEKTLRLNVAEEEYSRLDRLDRCGMATAYLGQETMPNTKRESIGMIRPSGWQISKYKSVDGEYLYNRCHLIGFQLSGENANERNLITGTRYMNVDGMLPFENMVADYIRSTNHHVLYEVTPVFIEDELVARGVQMQAQSIEDNRISFNVFVYNVQPGVAIDYATGDNHSAEWKDSVSDANATFVVNMDSKKFHTPDCHNVKDIQKDNRRNTDLSYDDLVQQGYIPASCCDHHIDQSEVHNFVMNTRSKKFHLEKCQNAKKISPENQKKARTTYQDLVNQGYEPSKCCL